MMPRKGQALVEFEDMEAAKACVEYTQVNTYGQVSARRQRIKIAAVCHIITNQF